MSTAPFLSLTTGGVSSNSALAKKIYIIYLDSPLEKNPTTLQKK